MWRGDVSSKIPNNDGIATRRVTALHTSQGLLLHAAFLILTWACKLSCLLLLLLLLQRQLGEDEGVVLVKVGKSDAVDAVNVGLLLLVDPGPHERSQEGCTAHRPLITVKRD